MFREITKKKKEITRDACIAILKNEVRGVLSVNGDDGYPYGMPMNHFYDDRDGNIYFHCGHREDAIKHCNKASFCVYENGYRNSGEWALNIRSVIVFGKIDIIDNKETVIDITTRLCHKFTSDTEYINKEISLFADKTLLLRFTPEHICGKIVTEA